MSPAVRSVLVLAGLFPPASRGGGGIRSIDALVAAERADVTLHVLTTNTDIGGSEPLPVETDRWVDYRQAKVMYLNAGGLRSLVLAVREIRRLRPDLYYLYSYFSPQFTILPLLLLVLRLIPRAPVLIAPHGELNASALAIKERKKRLYRRAFNLIRRLAPPITWHATTALERADIGSAVGTTRDRVIEWEEPNVNLPLTALATVPPPDDGRLHAVFISRVVKMKGLVSLLEALVTVEYEVALDVFGPQEDPEYWGRCTELISKLPPRVHVQYRGVLDPLEVIETFRRYELFTFPTAGESFGHIISESLAASCPVMLNDTTPWSETIRSGGGVVVDGVEPRAWAVAINEYAALPRADRDRRRSDAGGVFTAWQNRPVTDDVFDLMFTFG